MCPRPLRPPEKLQICVGKTRRLEVWYVFFMLTDQSLLSVYRFLYQLGEVVKMVSGLGDHALKSYNSLIDDALVSQREI